MNWFHCYEEFAELIEQYQIPVGKVFYPKDPETVEDLFFKMRVEFLQRYQNRDELLTHYMHALRITLSRSGMQEDASLRIPFREQWKLLRLRHAHPALRLGDYHPVDASGDLLAWERRLGQDRLLVVLNLGGRPQGFAIPEWAEGFRVLAAARGGADPALLGPDEGYVLG